MDTLAQRQGQRQAGLGASLRRDSPGPQIQLPRMAPTHLWRLSTPQLLVKIITIQPTTKRCENLLNRYRKFTKKKGGAT